MVFFYFPKIFDKIFIIFQDLQINVLEFVNELLKKYVVFEKTKNFSRNC